MPKRYNYTNKCQFFPLSNADLNKDDPSESQNVLIPADPEHFKYGIYFNDGYDYSQHLVSMEDFQNENIDLRQLVSNTTHSMVDQLPTKSATVLSEFQVDDETSDEVAIEKLKQISNNQIDEDVLDCLNNVEEYSDFEDDFMERADGVSDNTVVTGDKEIFNLFFNNGMAPKENNIDEDEQKDSFDSLINIRAPIDAIANDNDFENNCRDMQRFIVQNDAGTNYTMMSTSMQYAIGLLKECDKKKEYISEVDKNSMWYKNLYKGETEYSEEEIDDVVSEWGYRKPEITQHAMNMKGKKTDFKPKMIIIEKIKTNKRPHESMDIQESEDDVSEMVFTNVSEFHVPRPVDETAEEKRERKKAIKSAKRCRQEEKKLIKQTTKFVKSKI